MERTLGIFMIITDHCTTDGSFVPAIQSLKLGNREIKFPVQTGDQGLKAAPFFLEGFTAGQLELQNQDADSHGASSIIYSMHKEKNVLAWILVIGILVILTITGVAVAGGVWAIQDTTQRAVQPVSDMTSELSTQVARILHPTPTVLPDPVTIINQIRPLARLETIQYTVEKVITAEVGQGSLAPLFGDKLLFVGHGYVTAGIDLQDIGAQDFIVENGQIKVHLPEAKIFEATLDNDKSYVYDRETGMLTHGDINLETTARQAAEDQIRQAALDDGILAQAQANAETYMQSLLNKLGYSQVVFIQAGE